MGRFRAVAGLQVQGANRPADLLQDNKLLTVQIVRGQLDDTANAIHAKTHLPLCLG